MQLVEILHSHGTDRRSDGRAFWTVGGERERHPTLQDESGGVRV